MDTRRRTTHQQLTVFDGASLKSIDLPQYPATAWTWLSGRPDPESENPEGYFRAVPWLYRGVTLRADAVASMPFALFKGKREYDTSADWQNAAGFLANPSALLWLIEACLTLEPSCYLFSDNVGKYRKRLRYISPYGATPIFDPQNGNRLLYFDRYVPGAGLHHFQPVQDIVYFWRGDPYAEEGTPGKAAPGRAALMASGVMANVDTFVSAFFKRGAIKATVFTSEGMGGTEANRLEAWWSQFMIGIRNAFRTKVFNAKSITPTVVGQGLEGLQDTELTKEKREDISTALGIPQTILFSASSGGLGGGGVATQDDIRFYKQTVIPECGYIASVLNDQVFTPLGLSLKFLPETLEIFQEDEAARAAAMNTWIGAISAAADENLARAAFDVFGMELSPEADRRLTAYYAGKAERAAQVQDQMQPKPAPPGQESETETETDEPELEESEAEKAIRADLDKWKRKSLKALERGKLAAVPFESENIPAELHQRIDVMLATCSDLEHVKEVFEFMAEKSYEPPIPAPPPFAPVVDALRDATQALRETAIKADGDGHAGHIGESGPHAGHGGAGGGSSERAVPDGYSAVGHGGARILVKNDLDTSAQMLSTDDVKSMIDGVPEEYRGLIRDVRLTDTYWRDEDGTYNFNIAATYDLDDGSIEIHANDMLPVDDLREHYAGTMRHETAHALEEKLGSDFQKDWAKAVKKEPEHISEYGARDAHEDFAETIRHYWSSKSFDRRMVERFFPERKKVLDKWKIRPGLGD